MPIPKIVKRADLLEAMKPLCDLLGTSVNNFYDVPGMTIGNGRITFVVPALHEEPDTPGTRARGTKATDFVHPQGNEHAELALVVEVEYL